MLPKPENAEITMLRRIPAKTSNLAKINTNLRDSGLVNDNLIATITNGKTGANPIGNNNACNQRGLFVKLSGNIGAGVKPNKRTAAQIKIIYFLVNEYIII